MQRGTGARVVMAGAQSPQLAWRHRQRQRQRRRQRAQRSMQLAPQPPGRPAHCLREAMMHSAVARVYRNQQIFSR